MKSIPTIAVAALALGGATWTGTTHADSTDAKCEVRKDGETKSGTKGPCTFSQRQGYIDMDLNNGDTIRLSPAGNANHYRDQHGNKVARTSAGSTGMSLKWENGKHIQVTWSGNRYGNPTYDSSNYNSYGKHSGRSSGRDSPFRIEPLIHANER